MKKLREYNKRETTDLRKQWLAVFAKNRSGVNTKAYLWHIFSFARYPSVEGDEAISEYESQFSNEFVILPNDGENAYVVDDRPEKRPYSDYCIFPPNMAWTMAFTHEDGWLGPYFARHTDFDRLADANLAKIKKAEAIANAKAQGWM